jgi:DivIVA domain-containing protein
MANTEQEFTTELRGYKRSEVDEVINDLRAELIQAAKDRGNLLNEVTTLKEHVAAIDAAGGESLSPTYSGLGSRLEAILRIAEEQSTRIIGQADIDAERMISNAKLEAQSLLEAAQREAERIALDSDNRAANTLEGSTDTAEKLRQEAEAQAKRITDEAVEEASAIRGAVATESAKMRASAKRETEALRAEGKREIAELKVVAERELNLAREQASALSKEIEAERASHELTLKKIQEEAALAQTNIQHEVAETTAKLKHDNDKQADKLARVAEQARADLEAELTARRAEAEKELLDVHQKAVDLNNRFLKEAENQLAETKSRLAALRTEHQKITEAIDEANRTGKVEAQKKANDVLAQAETRAEEIIRSAESEATGRVAAAERRLLELRSERDTIAEYVESLRTIVGAVLDAPAPAKKVAVAKRSKPRAVEPQQSSAAS